MNLKYEAFLKMTPKRLSEVISSCGKNSQIRQNFIFKDQCGKVANSQV